MAKVVSRPVPDGLNFRLNLASVFGALVVAGMVWLIKATNDGVTNQAVMKNEVQRLRDDFWEMKNTLTLMASDRYTTRMHADYASAVEARLQRLESKTDALGHGQKVSN